MTSTLTDSCLFRGLSVEEAAEFAGRFEQLAVDRRELVFAEGQPGDQLYVVLAGKLKLFRRAPDGREAVLAVLGPGDLAGELSVVDGGPRPLSAAAIVPTRLARLTGADLRDWVRGHPRTAEELLRLLTRQVQRVTDAVTSAARTDVAGRLAGQLLELGVRFGGAQDGRPLVRHDLSQEELGQLVGATRETVNKTLGDFVRRGWIRLDGRSVVILEPALLARRAGQAAAVPARLPLAG